MGKQWKQWHFIFLGSKIPENGDCSHEIKRSLLLVRKAMTNLDSILKNRDITLDKGPSSQSYGFSSSHVWVWELDHKESWVLKNCAFELRRWRKLLTVPWKARRSNQSLLKEISPEYSLEGLMLKLKLWYFDHLMWGVQLSRVRLFATPWTVAYQVPPSMGFSRQAYWSGFPFSSPGDLPDPGIEASSPALQVDALPSEPPVK